MAGRSGDHSWRRTTTRGTHGDRRMMMYKQDYLDLLTGLLDQPRFVIPPGNGSSLPAYAFEAAARLARVPYTNMPHAAEQVILAAGLRYDYDSYDSRRTPSRGGGTVSRDGIAALVTAVQILLELNGVDPHREPETGQGRVHDPLRRKKIEMAAQDWLMGLFVHHGWAVTDTHIGRPYDAVATRGRDLVYLEAKGTTTDASTVIVTRNEVTWAVTHPGQCVLGIWSEIRFDALGDVLPDIGRWEIFDWQPEDHELSPIDYDWTVPQHKRIGL